MKRRPLIELTGHYRGFCTYDESEVRSIEATLDVDETGIVLRITTEPEITENTYTCNTLAFSSQVLPAEDGTIEVWQAAVIGSETRFIFVVSAAHATSAAVTTKLGHALFEMDVSDGRLLRFTKPRTEDRVASPNPSNS